MVRLDGGTEAGDLGQLSVEVGPHSDHDGDRSAGRGGGGEEQPHEPCSRVAVADAEQLLELIDGNDDAPSPSTRRAPMRARTFTSLVSSVSSAAASSGTAGNAATEAASAAKGSVPGTIDTTGHRSLPRSAPRANDDTIPADTTEDLPEPDEPMMATSRERSMRPSAVAKRSSRPKKSAWSFTEYAARPGTDRCARR